MGKAGYMSCGLGLTWGDGRQILPYKDKQYADLAFHKSGQASRGQAT